ncbi:dipeptidase [Kordiimonas sp. SCSIO 12610]|uniref:dipeptidase n=1 Tax=Kordiimonas sp. SCSIO 12610 TaxID=2829597 RepID=UPI002109F5DC|nr:dipeptidase [Kordiimonas sp. SCSIO 12610]UTW54942.1 dipeptidase [Kordiimonas sp. SCSIO 12610]
MKRFLVTSALGVILTSALSAYDVSEKANEIAKNTIIIDTHIDVPYRLNDGWIDVTKATEGGDFDYPRAIKGGLNAPFMSIYTPAALDGTPDAKKHAERMIGIVEKMVATAPEKFQIAHSVADVETAFKKGIIALPMGMENGSPISGDLDNIDYFYKRGIRYVTLSHSKANGISDSSYDDNRKWFGLSEFGVKAVERMNNIGVMVDVSHISDTAFWKVMEVAKAPAIASHSSVRKFTPGFERNMNDKMIKALAQQGGVIMINYGSSFLTKGANQYNTNAVKAYQAYLKAEGIENTTEAQEKFRKKYSLETPYPFATLNDVLDHIDHVVQITGSVDFVGIGSDYDGVGNTLPVGLKDVSSYPALIDGLLKRGYSEDDIKKILSGNILRVWRAVEDYAANH